MPHTLRYLLLQMRNDDDPMAGHEVDCFAWALQCRPDQIHVMDLLRETPTRENMARVDVALLGGSGDYSVAEGGPWLERVLDAMRELHDLAKPTFASCWGFQAMARALGGEVVTDLARAEVGTHHLNVTDAGAADPLFGPLAPTFKAQMGHQDIVDRLPAEAVLLASTDRVTNQAFKLERGPIYCTQFHPELPLEGLFERLRRYPSYVEKIAQMPFEEFLATCSETPGTEAMLIRFVGLVRAAA